MYISRSAKGTTWTWDLSIRKLISYINFFSISFEISWVLFWPDRNALHPLLTVIFLFECSSYLVKSAKKEVHYSWTAGSEKNIFSQEICYKDAVVNSSRLGDMTESELYQHRGFQHVITMVWLIQLSVFRAHWNDEKPLWGIVWKGMLL